MLRRPEHPYTIGLIDSLPETSRASGSGRSRACPPEPGHLPDGCAFAPRCDLAIDACRVAPIPMLEAATRTLGALPPGDELTVRRGLARSPRAGA